MSRRTVSYGDVKELFLAGETSVISADIQTGESGAVLNGAAPEVMYLSGDGQRLYSLTGQTLVCTEKADGKWQPDRSAELSASCDAFTLAGANQSPVSLEGTDLYT